MKAWTQLPPRIRLRIVEAEFKQLRKVSYTKRSVLQHRKMNSLCSYRARLKKKLREGYGK